MAYNARRRSGDNGLDAWPGYVDALSTLLMVIIFVLLVFVLAQAFLSVTLSGRDKALDKVNRQLAEMSDMLSLERGRTQDLRLSMADLNKALAASVATRDSLSQQLAAITAEAAKTSSDRDALRVDRDRLAAQLADAQAQMASGAARADQLQQQLSDAAGRTDAAGLETAKVAGDLAQARRQLTDMRQQLAALDQTVTADRATIQARLSDLAKLAEQTRTLTALRDQLEQQAQDAAAKATTEQQRRQATEALLSDEKKLGDSARAQIALLTQQVEQLRAQLAGVAKALDVAEASGRDKDVQITNLGQRLNAALAAKVEELQQYRSEFFGKLRTVLANRPGVQIVGDRFVFQSEVLFPVGSADMTGAGAGPNARASHHDQADRRRNPARCELDFAGGWPCRPAEGYRRCVRVQLGIVLGAGDKRGEAADRPGRAGQSPGGDRFRRQPAARSGRYARSLR